MAQKIIVTKPTYNAVTETNPDNIIFSSDYDTLKYYGIGTTTVTVNRSSYYASGGGIYYIRGETTVTHDLGYKPFFIGYILDIPNSGEAIQAPFLFSDFVFHSYYMVFADSVNLYFVCEVATDSNSGTFDVNFSYKIFRNNTLV